MILSDIERKVLAPGESKVMYGYRVQMAFIVGSQHTYNPAVGADYAVQNTLEKGVFYPRKSGEVAG
jgi:hypothetical protein